MRYTFEWDPIKAKKNLVKHRVSFDRAAELFLDPLAISILDQEHSDDEQLWVTIGKDSRGHSLILVHTFLGVAPGEAKIRIISARKPTKREARQYEELDP